MSTKSKSYAEQINDAQIMAKAIKTNLDTLKKRGMTDEFIKKLEALVSDATAQDVEQERLKADLKTATAKVEALLQQLHEQMQEASKVVKLEVPQSQWKEYGIAHKR